MGGAELDVAPLTLLVLDEVGGVAALAAVTAGSDFRPSEYPSAKNNAHTPTRPKNSTSSFPVPSVISVSSDEAITYPPCSDRCFRKLPERIECLRQREPCRLCTNQRRNYAVFPGAGLSSPGFPRIF